FFLGARHPRSAPAPDERPSGAAGARLRAARRAARSGRSSTGAARRARPALPRPRHGASRLPPPPKIVSVFRANPARGLPTVTSIYVLSDYETGAPLAIMDGGYLTAIRTAAGSAVATRRLARPDAATLGVFGTGVQARFHVETIRRVRNVRRVVV